MHSFEFFQGNVCNLKPNFNRVFTCSIGFQSESPYRQSYDYYFFRLVENNMLGTLQEDFTIDHFNIGKYQTIVIKLLIKNDTILYIYIYNKIQSLSTENNSILEFVIPNLKMYNTFSSIAICWSINTSSTIQDSIQKSDANYLSLTYFDTKMFTREFQQFA